MGANDAKDLVQKPSVGDTVPPAKQPPVPGKASLTGDAYSDHGAVCDGNPTGADCFLDNGQRSRLIGQFQNRVDKAYTNYVAAATQLHVEKLIQKPDDMHWAAALLIDLVVGHLSGQLAKTLMSWKDKTKLAEAAKSFANLADSVDDWETFDLASHKPSRMERAKMSLLSVKEDTVKDAAKGALDNGKKAALAIRSSNITDTAAGKQTAELSYIDQLMSAASLGYTKLGEATPATATDAELVALFQALAPENHLITDYKTAISAKIDRFMKSGVRKIGASYAERAYLPMEGEDIHNPKGPSNDVVRHTRVVWREYVSGYPKDLYLEHKDGKRNIGTIEPGEPGFPSQTPGPRDFGPKRAVTKNAELGARIPDEFHETAILRHETTWKEPVQTEMVDDSGYWWDSERAAQARANQAKANPNPWARAAQLAQQRAQQQPAPAPTPVGGGFMWQDVHDFTKAAPPTQSGSPVHDFSKGPSAPPPAKKPEPVFGSSPGFMWQDVHDFTKKQGA